MQKWDYLFVRTYQEYAISANGRYLGDPKRLNDLHKGGYPEVFGYVLELGDQGWELVVGVAAMAAFEIDGQLIFKRPKP